MGKESWKWLTSIWNQRSSGEYHNKMKNNYYHYIKWYSTRDRSRNQNNRLYTLRNVRNFPLIMSTRKTKTTARLKINALSSTKLRSKPTRIFQLLLLVLATSAKELYIWSLSPTTTPQSLDLTCHYFDLCFFLICLIFPHLFSTLFTLSYEFRLFIKFLEKCLNAKF